MSSNHTLPSYWRTASQSTDTRSASSEAQNAPSHEPPRPHYPIATDTELTGTTAASSSSPPVESIIYVVPWTPPHQPGSAGSTLSSPDSFPASPIRSDLVGKNALRPPSPSLGSKPDEAAMSTALTCQHGAVIQDSDSDGFDDASSNSTSPGAGRGALTGAFRFSRPPLLSQPVAPRRSASAAGRGSRVSSAGTAKTASSSPYSGASTPPIAKRPAAAVLTSPLPLRRAKQPRVDRKTDPPAHKFDMKALLRHAEQDDAVAAAARRASAALAEPTKRDQTTAIGVSGAQEHGDLKQPLGKPGKPASGLAQMPLLGDLLHVHDDRGNCPDGMGSARGRDGAGSRGKGDIVSLNNGRLRKALDRTEVAAISESWYFFKEHHVPSSGNRRPPYPKAATPPGSYWQKLSLPPLRQDLISTGVVHDVLSRARASAPGVPLDPDDASKQLLGEASEHYSGEAHISKKPNEEDGVNVGLPDEVFLWILDEASVGSQSALHPHYIAILQCCPEQIRRLVDSERLLQLLQPIGPRWESIDLSAQLELVPAIQRPYPGRDWSPLCSLLQLVGALAESLSSETATFAVKILLRLAIDRVVEETPDLLVDYQEAMQMLVARVPKAEWDTFVRLFSRGVWDSLILPQPSANQHTTQQCYGACSCLLASIQKPTLRWRVLACLPLEMPACHNLRQRLASAMFFDEPDRARQDPDQQLAHDDLAKLTVRDDFVLTAETDYPDLAALVNMMDAFLDDMDRNAVLFSDGSSAAARRDFDTEVDELARRLKVIDHGIEVTGGGHVSRLESKTALQRLQIRLTHTVRTRRPVKRGVFSGVGGTFAAAGGSREDSLEDEGNRARQQDIRSFFLQKLAKRVDR